MGVWGQHHKAWSDLAALGSNDYIVEGHFLSTHKWLFWSPESRVQTSAPILLNLPCHRHLSPPSRLSKFRSTLSLILAQTDFHFIMLTLFEADVGVDSQKDTLSDVDICWWYVTENQIILQTVTTNGVSLPWYGPPNNTKKILITNGSCKELQHVSLRVQSSYSRIMRQSVAQALAFWTTYWALTWPKSAPTNTRGG